MGKEMSEKEMQDFLNKNEDIAEPKESFFSKAAKSAKDVVSKVKEKAHEYEEGAKKKRRMDLEKRIEKAKEQKEFKKLEAKARNIERENTKYDQEAKEYKREKVKRVLAPIQGAVGAMRNMGGSSKGSFSIGGGGSKYELGGDRSNSLLFAEDKGKKSNSLLFAEKKKNKLLGGYGENKGLLNMGEGKQAKSMLFKKRKPKLKLK